MRFSVILLILSVFAAIIPALAENEQGDKTKSNLLTKIQSMTKQDFIDAYKQVHSRVPAKSPKAAGYLMANKTKFDFGKPQVKEVNTIQSLPENITIPGEYEEVKAIVITWPYVTYDSVGKGAEQVFDGIGYCRGENNEWYIGPVYSIVDTFSLSPFPYVFSNLAHAIDTQAEVWINIWNAEDSTIIKNYMDSVKMPLKNYKFFVNPGNSFWYRDCGPVGYYFGDKDSVGFIDFEYYSGRPLDDAIPLRIAEKEGYPVFTTGIEYEGGNILLDGSGTLFTTDAVYLTNSDSEGQYYIDNEGYINVHTKEPLSAIQVRDSLVDILNLDRVKIMPSLKFDGGTGHIDLYADMYDENTFIFSKYPEELKNFKDYSITAKNIDTIMSIKSANNGDFTKRYIPFPKKDDGTWYYNEMEYNYYTRTYSNHTFVNKTIIQPVFSNGVDGDVANMEKDLDAIEKQYPGYTIYPIDVRSFDGSGGAIHCITKQIPADNPLRILHKPIASKSQVESSYPILAKITNNSGIASARVMWRYSDSKDFTQINMAAGSNNEFTAEIPNDRDNDSIEYYITATSNNGKTISKPITAPDGYYGFKFGANTAGVEDNIKEPSFAGEFYPNPASGKSQVIVNSESKSLKLTIYSLAGDLIYTNTAETGTGENIITLNTESFASGSYVVFLQTGNGKTVHRMLNVIR